jgi:putative sterol carrier protein
MSIQAELAALVDKMNANPELIKDEKDRVFQVNLEESRAFQIILQDGKVQVEEATPHEAEVTLFLSDKNFLKFLRGDLNTAMAFMMGSLKVEGKMGLALKLQEIVKQCQS